jgi:serine/threonine protein kinase
VGLIRVCWRKALHDGLIYHLCGARLDRDEEDYPGMGLIGLLLTYIDNKGTLTDVAPWPDCTDEDRFRWLRQIRDSVEYLHAAGVAWGGAKPENLLVDREGNACLAGFGGSYTPGWVDREKRETIERDRQGVERIDEWLDNCPTTLLLVSTGKSQPTGTLLDSRGQKCVCEFLLCLQCSLLALLHHGQSMHCPEYISRGIFQLISRLF